MPQVRIPDDLATRVTDAVEAPSLARAVEHVLELGLAALEEDDDAIASEIQYVPEAVDALTGDPQPPPVDRRARVYRPRRTSLWND